jgi:hypothetical protein
MSAPAVETEKGSPGFFGAAIYNWSHVLRQFDSPWLLVALPPLILQLNRAVGSSALPGLYVIVPAAFLAGRRWGVSTLLPSLLVACLIFLPVPGLWPAGESFSAAAVLLAARLGFDPNLASRVAAIERLDMTDRAVLFALLVCSVRIALPAVPVLNMNGEMTLLPLLMLLLGMSRVGALQILGLLLPALACLWLLSPDAPDDIRTIVQVDFGMWPHVMLEALAMFGVGRSIAHPGRPVPLPLGIAALLFLPVMIFSAVASARVSAPDPMRSWATGITSTYGFSASLSLALAWFALCLVLSLRRRGRQPGPFFSTRRWVAVVAAAGAALWAGLQVPTSPRPIEILRLVGLNITIGLPDAARDFGERTAVAVPLCVGMALLSIWLRRERGRVDPADGGGPGFTSITLGRGWQVAALSVPVLGMMLAAGLILAAPAGDPFLYFRSERNFFADRSEAASASAADNGASEQDSPIDDANVSQPPDVDPLPADAVANAS